MAEITREEIAKIIKAKIQVYFSNSRATGLIGFNDAADAILARLGGGWRSCRNDPPEVGVHVWACDGPSKCPQSQYEAWIEYNPIHGEVWTDWADSEPNPAYWQPLPAPPKESE